MILRRILKVESKAGQQSSEAELTQFDNYRNGGLLGGLVNVEPLSGSMYALGEDSLRNGSKGKFILKEESRKRKHLVSRKGLLLSLLAFFVILSLILSGLLAWVALRKKEETRFIKKAHKDVKMCKFMADPINFRTLPLNVKKQLEDLDNFIKREIERRQATALSANLVYLDKVIWEGGFGVMNPNNSTSESPTSRTIYPCASLTKILTSLMLFKLHSKGLIPSLDIPINYYEPEFSIRNPYQSNMTLRDIASQRSGLQREAPCYPATPTNLCPYNYSTMLRRISKLTLLRRPGTEPQYRAIGHEELKIYPYQNSLITSYLSHSRAKACGFLIVSELSALPKTTSSNNIMDWGWLVPSGGLYSSVYDLAQTFEN
ncbi:putative beta-lactamase-like 1 [Exaiptasia diaphana]|nr:putative beta-lactamase-like 1 [Exaiptasia diaphana]